MPYSIAELKMNTLNIVNSSKKEDVVLTDNRKPVAVIISYERYNALLSYGDVGQPLQTLAELRSRLDLVDDFALSERTARSKHGSF